MTMLHTHDQALEAVSAAYHEFLLRYKANANLVYGIVEGKEDPMFYRGLIERSLPSGWNVELVRSGSKANVLKAMALFDWSRYSRNRICFFIDRDLADFTEQEQINAANLYVTDNYSIENDTVTFPTLRRVLEEALNIGDLRPAECDVLEQRFNAGLASFQEAMVPIMAQILIWQRNGLRPCLDDIRPKDFFTFTNGCVSLKAKFESTSSRVHHAAQCVDCKASPDPDLSKVDAEFRQRNGAAKFIRGKYLLWFMIEFAFEIHRSISVLLARFARSPKLRISMGAANAMVVIAPRARCPASLNNFLDRTYGEYVRDSTRIHASSQH